VTQTTTDTSAPTTAPTPPSASTPVAPPAASVPSTPTEPPSAEGVDQRARARWERPAIGGLLLATALLYLWGLGESGWANSFYSAAVQAGSESWKAFFFGSSDAANSITVDKTPLALWPMVLSVRIFGQSSWSILVPQALFGVASVWLLYRTVRRTTGSAPAGLIAGSVLALTPVAVLMFRFNNPDALLTLLLIGAAATTLRAIEESRRPTGRALLWVSVGGALVGLAFLTKMLQAFLVLPALALAYALFAAVPIGRRIGHLLAAFGAMVAAAGWWIAIVELWPADSRPYIGGSQYNSILELTLGYNGFGRLTGDETGSVGGGGGWGETGLTRLFDAEIGGQIAWLLPAALMLGGAALWFGRRDRRVLAALTVWLGWLVVTGLTFSLMVGIFHAYYTVALAPAIGALVGIGAWVLWRQRTSLAASVVLSLAVFATSVTSFVLLDRAGDWYPWLKYAVITLGLASALMIAGVRHLARRVGAGVAAVALAASLAGPAAYSLSTAATPHTGSIPTAGPSTGGGLGPGGGGPGGGAGGGPGDGGAFAPPTGGTITQQPPTQGQTQGGQAQGGQTQGGPGGGSSAGGLLRGSDPGSEITALLEQDADSYTWVAAAVGSNTASGYQLATQLPVMAIGGFNGSDPSPTLEQFQAWVAAGDIHYFIAGGDGRGGFGPGGDTASEITTWVTESFTAQTLDGITVYDLSAGADSSATGTGAVQS
jgi:4-amino-4-deoxy-L-arabinose transferase-like glycosyltransferase